MILNFYGISLQAWTVLDISMMTTLPHHYCWLLCLGIVVGLASSVPGLVGAPLFLEPASINMMSTGLLCRSPSQHSFTGSSAPSSYSQIITALTCSSRSGPPLGPGNLDPRSLMAAPDLPPRLMP